MLKTKCDTNTTRPYDPVTNFKHLTIFLTSKAFIFNCIVTKRSHPSLTAFRYSRLKTVHNNYNTHKQPIQADKCLFLIT